MPHAILSVETPAVAGSLPPGRAGARLAEPSDGADEGSSEFSALLGDSAAQNDPAGSGTALPSRPGSDTADGTPAVDAGLIADQGTAQGDAPIVGAIDAATGPADHPAEAAIDSRPEAGLTGEEPTSPDAPDTASPPPAAPGDPLSGEAGPSTVPGAEPAADAVPDTAVTGRADPAETLPAAAPASPEGAGAPASVPAQDQLTEETVLSETSPTAPPDEGEAARASAVGSGPPAPPAQGNAGQPAGAGGPQQIAVASAAAAPAAQTPGAQADQARAGDPAGTGYERAGTTAQTAPAGAGGSPASGGGTGSPGGGGTDTPAHHNAFAQALGTELEEGPGLRTGLSKASPEPTVFASPSETDGPLIRASSPTQTAFGSLPTLPMRTIAVHMASRLAGGQRQFEIRLDPPELGRIDVRMEITRDGQVTAQLAADRPETLDALQRDQRALERALQTAGLDVDSGALKFSLRGDGQDRRTGDGAAEAQTPSDTADDGADDDGGDMQTRIVSLSAVDIRV